MKKYTFFLKQLRDRIVFALLIWAVSLFIPLFTSQVKADTKITDVSLTYDVSETVLTPNITYKQWTENFLKSGDVSSSGGGILKGSRVAYIWDTPNVALRYSYVKSDSTKAFSSYTNMMDQYIEEGRNYYVEILVGEKEGYFFDLDNLTSLSLKLNGKSIPVYASIAEADTNHGAFTDKVHYSDYYKELDIFVPIEFAASYEYTPIKISFDANGGTGTMEDQYMPKGGVFTFPRCLFMKPSADKPFSGWIIGDSVYKYQEQITLTEDTVIKARWQGTLYDLTVNNGKTQDGTKKFEKGDKVTIVANGADEDYCFNKWSSEDSAVTFADPNSATTTFVMPGNAVTVTALRKARLQITDSTISVSGSVYLKPDGTIEPKLSVKYNSELIKEKEDYTLSLSEPTSTGEVVVTIEGQGRLKGSVSKTFIVDRVIEEVSVDTSKIIAGGVPGAMASVTAKPAGSVVSVCPVYWMESKDDSLASGSAMSSTSFIEGVWYGIELDFASICKEHYKVTDDTVIKINGRIVDKSDIKTLFCKAEKETVETSDKKDDNADVKTDPGKTVEASTTDPKKDSSSQEASIETPQKAVIQSAKNNKKRQITVKLTSLKADGYEIQYSTVKGFKKGKSTKSKVFKKTTCKLTKLKKGKKYFIRVRAYNLKADGAKVYGKWSQVKKVVVKK